MFNNYYRLNESRWGLPEEDGFFKYPNYRNDKKDYNLLKDKNLKEGWDKKIINLLEDFYDLNKEVIVTEYDELENYKWYDYIDFSYLTPEEIIYIKNKIKIERNRDWVFNEDEDKTYLVREVIRENPKLNPSDILFFEKLYYPSIVELSKKLSCAIKNYCFLYSNNSLSLRIKYIYFLGHSFEIY